jgi:hypothetical protein
MMVLQIRKGFQRSGWFHITIRAEMLRLESNTRTIDHNVIAQSSTNNGGMDFHVNSMAVWAEKRKSNWQL